MMLPVQPRNHKVQDESVTITNTFFSSHLRLNLFITFLIIQLILVCTVFTRKGSLTTPLSKTTPPPHCPFGKFYVYQLPSELNHNLVPKNCSDLNPYRWQCGVATNHGYGGPAASDLRGVVPDGLLGSWYRTNQFSLEVIFHHRVLSHRCRTEEEGSAAAYYVPFYAGLAVGKYLWENVETWKRDMYCKKMLRWVKRRRPWVRSNGSDHFMAIGRITWDFRRLTDPGQLWGSTFLNMKEMEEVTRLIIEKAPGVAQDIAVPYPTGFHPRTQRALSQWQSFVLSRDRTTLFTFIGATRGWVSNDFRRLLLDHCLNQTMRSCHVVDCSASQCSTDTSVVLQPLLSSKFCLQPRGDSLTRRSVFDCMISGSVPVFFWNRTAYDQYEWFLPGEPESYSVFIDHESVRSQGTGLIEEVLMGFGEEEIARKREKVVESIPRIVYGMGSDYGENGFKDAFDIAVDGVLERIMKKRKDEEDDGK